jgi:hypothetical protein
MWHRQVEAARELYQQGRRETLLVLYESWWTIAEDVRPQPQLTSLFLTSASSKVWSTH